MSKLRYRVVVLVKIEGTKTYSEMDKYKATMEEAIDEVKSAQKLPSYLSCRVEEVRDVTIDVYKRLGRL